MILVMRGNGLSEKVRIRILNDFLVFVNPFFAEGRRFLSQTFQKICYDSSCSPRSDRDADFIRYPLLKSVPPRGRVNLIPGRRAF